MAEAALKHRDEWNELDAAAGDGDFGTTMARGFGAVLDEWEELATRPEGALLRAVAEKLSRAMGASSGPLLAASFQRAGEAWDAAEGVTGALDAAVAAIADRGGARVGDKTLLDALVPAVEAVTSAYGAGETRPARLAEAAAAAARTGAAATAGIAARRGRAAYVGDRGIGTVDPGAAAVAVLAAEVAALAGGDSPPPTRKVAEPAPVPQPPAAKHLVNDPADAVDDALSGFALAHPNMIMWDRARRIVVRAAPGGGRVGVVSGGGSGHEPMHVGFVGSGMLTAVAPGPVFASPTVHQILDATLAADSGAGVLHLVKNYTGDVMNFAMAAERAAERGVAVRTVIVMDDAATRDVASEVGPRGTGATVLAEKMAGAKAESGGRLDEVAAVAQRAVDQAASFGVALGSCTPPGGERLLDLGGDEIEIGVGIHGEPGMRRSTIAPAGKIVEEAARTLLDCLPVTPDDELLAFVSGLGGTPLLEQYLVYAELESALGRAGHRISRRLVGPYLTALDMPGVVITLLRLDDELTGLWDAPVCTPGLRWGG
ncbi:dihydroxyacetone kinase subunit DhaK [Actinomadura madurae]|uniref:dihydroxyacetone kinase subunit DhaK n=1 Tax=Actinomadura madurae TaxID=1993 RepID=UPI0020269C46|nr:dihydroxyacetone kinase subunit DhaK [Actinomadura madurae]MCP9972414.1 dihydroxyacetone kinase subunit DhaK [Actinomadura madurae]MCQ0021122.1 dihydroxyacetone kinase subunit DhaK [Actinomadura madurae]URN01132.1 dihydroxyacetone kinase subunit DhaK [Actinomadura madurae]URN03272.1 dihydroxyacetone kinase subunit DhaK [Actinomadura madurae]